ncbi:NADH dehydrogenase (ubiquinone) Fe-S protein 3, variant [Fonticula alba]|uniref:NADH dehydrogenase (Ubiquinone) Fe-S protein 3 n=1 Tax=Fonticula alba TaxID=691883 RepID=A0A058Z6H0_FONAL|nr:NADH dehydrogenase (ubiquinone) Fe-S protein 3 [Fonticula alba]XP_009496059.1 NADH dehydrogenase (ubiquinone) Fe-S protein 3, variant [Fonticula alba]KCV69493.1 NADH dehydrogenase (ubiquinone) Fe-S protein 3 [Fonticula alba]KCV69494.1 NADH dehydrogenase (ubiquinone) Fe-S protein 3, variant [Fonticula alba]|eukprot:XP_009496058.1 NADH dehydrogenase (ubiquinone) Fe-S protein 3 [Fonticula alba]
MLSRSALATAPALRALRTPAVSALPRALYTTERPETCAAVIHGVEIAPPKATLTAKLYREQTEKHLKEFGQYLVDTIPRFIQGTYMHNGQLTILTAPENITKVSEFLRDHTPAQYKQLADVTAVDFPMRSNRFEIVYNFLSHRFNSRIRVKTYASETSTVPSVTPLFFGANWQEREVWDLFGVYFTDHPDLRRIMTDYGFEGHPLRKDFPLSGYYEIRYDDEQKCIVQEPVELTQEYRKFDFHSPWEALQGSRKTPNQN